MSLSGAYNQSISIPYYVTRRQCQKTYITFFARLERGTGVHLDRDPHCRASFKVACNALRNLVFNGSLPSKPIKKIQSMDEGGPVRSWRIGVKFIIRRHNKLNIDLLDILRSRADCTLHATRRYHISALDLLQTTRVLHNNDSKTSFFLLEALIPLHGRKTQKNHEAVNCATAKCDGWWPTTRRLEKPPSVYRKESISTVLW